MALHTGEALVLRTYRLGESDRLVVMLTRDRGKKRGVARGGARSRKRFGGALEPFTHVRVAYQEREHRDLVRFDYADVLGSPLTVGGEACTYAGYFAELLDEWAQEGDPNERLYRLGATTLEALAEGVPTGALARYFEYWLLRLQGVYPPHLACRACLGRLDERAGGAWLRAGADAFFCEACAGDAAASGGIRISADSLRALGAWGRTGPSALEGLAPRVERELEAAHRALLARHLEKDLRSSRVLRDLRR